MNKRKRKNHVFTSILLLTALFTFCTGLPSAAGEDPERPNVLFIAVDDLNDWIGAMDGHPQVKTPNLDRLASRGTTFTRAYSNVPACNPSRKSVLSGLRPSTSGLYYNQKRIREEVGGAVTLPEHFKNNGYRVVGGGKIFHPGMKDPNSWHRHFDRPDDPEPKKTPHQGFPEFHHYWRWQPLVHYGDGDMADGKLAAWAERFLGRDHEKPFFLGVGFFRPHLPWHVPEKYFELYPPSESIKRPEVKEDDTADLPGYGKWFATGRAGKHEMVTEANEWRPAVRAYMASISFMDAMLGRVLDALDQSPYADNTIIVLWSDNGLHMGEKQHWTKWGLWEHATRTPLIVSAPGVGEPGRKSDTPVALLDIYPTLVDLCDLPDPGPFTVQGGDKVGLEGKSLVPQLRDPAKERERPVISTHGHMNHAIRTDRWRYIRYRDGSEELYDHRNDPKEWHNIADDPKYESVKERLRQWLPERNVPDPPYEGRKQYWPGDPTPNKFGDYPGW